MARVARVVWAFCGVCVLASVCALAQAQTQQDPPAVERIGASVATARERALERLAAARRSILAERADLTAEIREAYASLAEARRTRDDALEHERAVGAELDELEERAREARSRWWAEVERVAALAGVRPIGDEPRTAAEDLVLRLDDRLEALKRALALRVATETVHGRDGRLREAPVVRLGAARAVAIGRDPTTLGFLDRLPLGSYSRVRGRSFGAGRQDPSDPLSHVVLDVDGTLVREEPVARRTIGGWLRAGRFFIWPIVAVFMAGVLLVLERTWTLARLPTSASRWYAIAPLVARGDVDRVRGAVRRTSPIGRMIHAGLDTVRAPRGVREATLERVLTSEAPRLTRGLPVLQVLAAVAPLLGLLGTVTGMIAMFTTLSARGLGEVSALSSGISEALVTTQAGMVVAIPLVLAHAVLARWADRKLLALDEVQCAILATEAPE